MKKLYYLISLTVIAIALGACVSTTQASAANLPTAVQDPLLWEGWTLLNQLTTPVQLWHAKVISGHDLAQFALDHAIPIIWDVNNRCGGNSCSMRCETANACLGSDGKPAAHPIYISLSHQEKNESQLDDLVRTLAHEIYHYTLPFGAVDDTLFEEFSAYYVGEHVGGKPLLEFENYNPLNPACLVKWFYDIQDLEVYQHLHAYPLSALPFVEKSATVCSQPGNSHMVAASAYLLICSLNSDDHTDCIFPTVPTQALESRDECNQIPLEPVSCIMFLLTQQPSIQTTLGAQNK